MSRSAADPDASDSLGGRTPVLASPEALGVSRTLAWIALAGVASFFKLPVASLPQVDFPVISVSATLPGASPQSMATSVATPLERRLATIAGVNEITSSSGSEATGSRKKAAIPASAIHAVSSTVPTGRRTKGPVRFTPSPLPLPQAGEGADHSLSRLRERVGVRAASSATAAPTGRTPGRSPAW